MNNTTLQTGLFKWLSRSKTSAGREALAKLWGGNCPATIILGQFPSAHTSGHFGNTCNYLAIEFAYGAWFSKSSRYCLSLPLRKLEAWAQHVLRASFSFLNCSANKNRQGTLSKCYLLTNYSLAFRLSTNISRNTSVICWPTILSLFG